MDGEASPKEAVSRTVIIHEQNRDRISYTLSGHRFPAALSAEEKAYFALQ